VYNPINYAGERRIDMKKEYWTLRIYYGGDGPVTEVFETEAEANEFYVAHDMCDNPERWTPETPEQAIWAESRIATRLASASTQA
jgi:hypothetical protein